MWKQSLPFTRKRRRRTCSSNLWCTTSHFSVLFVRSTNPAVLWIRVKMVQTLHIVLRDEIKQLIRILLWKRSMQIRISLECTVDNDCHTLPCRGRRRSVESRSWYVTHDKWYDTRYEVRLGRDDILVSDGRRGQHIPNTVQLQYLMSLLSLSRPFCT